MSRGHSSSGSSAKKREQVLTRSNRHMMFAVSLLVLAIAATSIPPSVAQVRVGEIILNPTHAVPGTLVSFQGVGWYLPVALGVAQATGCRINGEPVKMDTRSICNVLWVSGIGEPVGTFVVANVAAGTYKIYISVDIPYMYPSLVGSQGFTVDAATTTSSVATTTLATSLTSYTSVLTTALTPTPVLTVTATVTTTKAESPSMPQAPDYTTVLAPLSIVAVCLVLIAAVVVLRRRKKPHAD